MKALVSGALACALVACGTSTPPPPAAPVDVSPVDGGAVSGVPAPARDDRQELAKLLDEMLAFLEGARARCASADATVLARVSQMQATVYMDRDEVALRNRDDNWPADRGVEDWLRRRRESLRELRELVTRRCEK